MKSLMIQGMSFLVDPPTLRDAPLTFLHVSRSWTFLAFVSSSFDDSWPFSRSCFTFIYEYRETVPAGIQLEEGEDGRYMGFMF
ncbi:hypothetical protein A2U01_0059254 [Trifolium medium]|uniref:Uncharacterized protein n=1 Tax=Trifolium medium TaxID=97028 RepID=A0A392RR38_9FABA|nr:hypothetical protein [Trifolium medium]